MNFRGTLRRVAGAGLALAAVGAVLMAPATAGAAPTSVTADPSTPFELIYGATKASGTIRWHQRSADIDFTLKASYCRRFSAFVYDANGKEYPAGGRSTSLHCDATKSDSWNIPVNVPGGPSYAHLCLQDENDRYLVCTRYDRP